MIPDQTPARRSQMAYQEQSQISVHYFDEGPMLFNMVAPV
jgi:hypothetical protein